MSSTLFTCLHWCDYQGCCWFKNILFNRKYNIIRRNIHQLKRNVTLVMQHGWKDCVSTLEYTKTTTQNVWYCFYIHTPIQVLKIFLTTNKVIIDNLCLCKFSLNLCVKEQKETNKCKNLKLFYIKVEFKFAAAYAVLCAFKTIWLSQSDFLHFLYCIHVQIHV